MTRPASSRRGGSSEGSSIRAVFYFDLGSPYAYLAAERIGRLFPEPPLWRPILLGGLFKRFGTSSWALGAARATNVAEIERRARAYGLPPVVWPKPFPGNTLFAMRTEHAGDLGVRGVPSLLVGSTIYFGDDRLDEAAAAAKRHGRARS